MPPRRYTGNWATPPARGRYCWRLPGCAGGLGTSKAPSAEEGKIYCEYEAPSVELIFEHAQRAGIPIDSAEVVRELEPSMFR